MQPAIETTSPASTDPRPLRLRILRVAPIVLILGLLVHLLLPRLDTITDSLETLRSMAPWAIAMAILMESLSYVANGALLQSIVGIGGNRISLGRAAAIEIGAGSVALVAAGALGFGAAVYKWTRDGGVSEETAMLVGWLPSMFDATALILFAIVSGIELLLFHRLSRLTVTALVLVVSVLSVVIAGTIVLLARSDWMMATVAWASRLMKKVRPGWDDSGLIHAAKGATEAWQRMRNGGWIRPACCSLMVLTFDLLCLRFAFLAAGQAVHISLLLAGYGVPLLLGRASFVPGGVAVIEVAMAALFGGLGVPANVAVVAVLTYRLLSFWLPALIGIPVAATLHAHRKQ
jgi:glycosyltransferase 2 family protein